MISDASFPNITVLLLSLSAGIFAWFIGVVGYRAFFHPLAKVPGPPLAALTYLYVFYFNIGKTSRLYAHIEKLHERYGSLFQAPPMLGRFALNRSNAQAPSYESVQTKST